MKISQLNYVRMSPYLSNNSRKRNTVNFGVRLDEVVLSEIAKNSERQWGEKRNDVPESFRDRYSKQDKNGQVFAHFEDAQMIRAINIEFGAYPELLAKMYLTQDNQGKTPIFYADCEKMRMINDGLKDQPEVLAKMYLLQDKEGRTALHYADYEKMLIIIEALKDQPEALAKLYLTKDKKGDLAAHHFKGNAFLVMNKLFENDSNTLADIYLTKNNLGKYPANGIPWDWDDILDGIRTLAVKSDLCLEKSIQLLETYSDFEPHFEALANYLKQHN